MYTLICGSPKGQKSNSNVFLNKVACSLCDYNRFDIRKDKFDDILDSIKNSDAIVLSFPLYVDSPTSLMLSFLDYVIDNKINLDNKLVYVIVNCGFREGKHNITAVNIIKSWCEKVGASYCSSILIGAGEIVGKKKYKFISKKAFRKIDEFSEVVKNMEKGDDIITKMDLLGNRMYCYIANIFWNKKGRANGLLEYKIREK